MKVVAFDGSKEPRGPVGRRVAALVARLQSAGVDVELVRLERVRHTGCYMCGQCGHRTAPIGCDRPAEDGLRRVVRKLKAADGVIVATPAYGTNSSPATQEVLIRLEHDRREKGDTRLAGKPAAVIAGPRGSGTDAVVAGVSRRLEAHDMAVVAVLDTGGPGEDAETGVDELAAALVAALQEPVALSEPVV